MKHRHVIVCVVLFLFALLIQKIVLTLSPIANFEKHVLAARLYFNSELDPERVTDFSPFYFELHLALLNIFGSYERQLMLLQVIASGISVVVLYKIALKFLLQWSALSISLAFVFSSGLAVLTQIFVPDIWFLTFLLLGVFFLLAYFDDEQSLSYIFFSSTFFGLALFTRPTILLYIPFALLFIILKSKGSAVKASSYFLLTFLVFFSLFLFRNYAYTGKATLAVMDSGGVFFEGNNPYSDGDGVNTPLVKDLEGQYLNQPSYAQHLAKRIPSSVAGHKMDPASSNSYWQSKALNYITENPIAYSRVFSRKIYRLFRSSENHDVLVAHMRDTELRSKNFPMIPISIVSAFALYGLYIKREDWKNLLPLYASFFIGCAVPIIYFASSRYRLALIPFLLFFGFVGIESLVKSFRNRKFRELVLFCIFAIFMVFALDWPEETGKTDKYIWQSIKEAHRLQHHAANLRNSGKRVDAARTVSESIAVAPFLQESLVLSNLPYEKDNPLELAIKMKRDICRSSTSASCLFDLGLILLESGQMKDASEIFQFLTESNEIIRRWSLCSPYPEYYLGRIATSNNQWNEALKHYKNVLRMNPGDPDTLAGITVTFEKLEKKEEAIHHRGKLLRYFDEPDAIMFLGRAYFYANDYPNSADCFIQVVRWLSDYRKAHVFAAGALGKSNRIEEAVAEYGKALAIKQEPLLLQKPILEFFREYAYKRKTPASQYAYGLVLRQFGRFQEAFEIQNSVLKQEPNFNAAKSEIDGLNKIFENQP